MNEKLSLLNVMERVFYDYNVEIINSGIKNGTILALV